jgi:hypothetical protein
MVAAAGRHRVPGYNLRVTDPLPELGVDDLELDVGGARLAARRLLPGAAAAAAPTLVILHEAPTVVIDLVEQRISKSVTSESAPALRRGARGGA